MPPSSPSLKPMERYIISEALSFNTASTVSRTSSTVYALSLPLSFKSKFPAQYLHSMLRLKKSHLGEGVMTV